MSWTATTHRKLVRLELEAWHLSLNEYRYHSIERFSLSGNKHVDIDPRSARCVGYPIVNCNRLEFVSFEPPLSTS